jgi:hypothetical protein
LNLLPSVGTRLHPTLDEPRRRVVVSELGGILYATHGRTHDATDGLDCATESLSRWRAERKTAQVVLTPRGHPAPQGAAHVRVDLAQGLGVVCFVALDRPLFER